MNRDKKYYLHCRALDDSFFYFVFGLCCTIIASVLFQTFWLLTPNILTFAYVLYCNYRIRYNLKKYA